MSFHPSGVTIEIVGTEASSNGRSCKAHEVCGRSDLFDDVVVRLRKVQILNEQQIEETAIAAYLVSDGIDQCRVGFLQRHLLKYVCQYDGVLAQVTEVYCADSESPTKRKKYHHNRGCCLAAIISSIPADATPATTTALCRTNQLETPPPRRRDNESSGSQGDEVSSEADNDVSNVATGRDKVVDDTGGEPATVAAKETKKA
jgi:hypothetical protein